MNSDLVEEWTISLDLMEEWTISLVTTMVRLEYGWMLMKLDLNDGDESP